jgi:hypothetical protein
MSSEPPSVCEDYSPPVSTATVRASEAVIRKVSRSTDSFTNKEEQAVDSDVAIVEGAADASEKRSTFFKRLHPFILGGLGGLIFAWWISSIVLEATRHGW